MPSVLANRLDRAPLELVTLAGGGWGLAVAAGFLAMNAQQCGLPCPADAAMTFAISIGTGLITIGPLTVLLRRR